MIRRDKSRQVSDAPTNAPAIQCRQCGSPSLHDLGEIPPANVFAGQPLEPPWPGGALYRCLNCHLVLRAPIRGDEEYEQLYARASGQVWISPRLRSDQRRVIAQIESSQQAGSVLDVGCYDGKLLAALEPRFRRFGVEASQAAADLARTQGIDIVASTIRDLGRIARCFDVICAVDVIEHVSQPKEFIALLAERLNPGGRLIISTGNAECQAWRAAGGRYWYCSFPEHISFVSPTWAMRVAHELGLSLSDVKYFAHGDFDGLQAARQRRRFRRKLFTSQMSRALRSWLPARDAALSARHVLGQPGAFEDHVLLQFSHASVLS